MKVGVRDSNSMTRYTHSEDGTNIFWGFGPGYLLSRITILLIT